MDATNLQLRRSVGLLCDAVKLLERSISKVADPALLRECADIRRRAESVLLAGPHPIGELAATTTNPSIT